MKDKKEMVLYHGSGNDYDNPSLKYSRKDIDFGKGYYLTPSLNTAKKWACTKEEAYIYKYKLNIENLNIYHFNLDEEWLEFILKNRRNKTSNDYKEYDVLVGAIANDKMYNTIRDYEIGLLTKKQTIFILNIGGFNNQFVIKNPKTLKKLKLLSKTKLPLSEKKKIREQVLSERITISKMTEEYRIKNKGE